MTEIQKLFDLQNRVAIITGGAGLLGEQFCRTLAIAGASVVVVDKNGAAANRVAESLLKEGLQALAIETDVTDSESIHSMVTKTLAAFGRINILVNSAAMDPKFDGQLSSGLSATTGKGDPALNDRSSFESFPLDAWNEALAVNLTGVFLITQAVVQPMLEGDGGVIVNLCSIYGLSGPDQRIYQRSNLDNPDKFEHQAPSDTPQRNLTPTPQYKPVYYSVTKAGILGFTRYLAAYYAGKPIRVNALTPGGVFNRHDEQFLQAYSARTIMGRMARKDEMNGALLFLVSDASSYMTGANLVVDGGWTAW